MKKQDAGNARFESVMAAERAKKAKTKAANTLRIPPPPPQAHRSKSNRGG